MRRHVFLLAAIMTVLFSAGTTAAPPKGDGVLNAVSFQPLSATPTFEVRVLDDSADNLAIKQELEAALAHRGYRLVETQGDVVLTIDTGDAVGAWRSPAPSNQVRLMDDRGRLFPRGELDVTSVARYPLPETTVVTPAQYRIGLTLDDAESGTRLWQGWTFADLSQGEPADLAAAMVQKLADSIGRSVREESFPLQ
jgi:hypothetical protein